MSSKIKTRAEHFPNIAEKFKISGVEVMDGSAHYRDIERLKDF